MTEARPDPDGGVPDSLAWLREAAERRRATGVHRAVRPRAVDETVLDLASNDYLGLARDPRVVEAAREAALVWGAGATGSRLVTGSTALHAALEAELAEFVGAASGLVFSSGYLANLAAVTALAGPDTLVVSDALNHASVVDACRLSRAPVAVVSHRDPAAVEARLSRRTEARAVVVTDAVFSVDGDLAPLGELHTVARRHGALLVVDEAHALGVLGPDGRGAAHAAGLAGQPDVVLTVTLSKSLGAQGGAVLADEAVATHLVNTARSFIFDTALAPPSAAAAQAALGVLRSEPGLAADVRARARDLAGVAARTGLPVTVPEGAVVSVLVGEPGRAFQAARRLFEQGVLVGCFRPPSVPDGVSRLRLTARADLNAPDLERLAVALDTL